MNILSFSSSPDLPLSFLSAMIIKQTFPDAPVFDVDSETGFMAPVEPLSRLPAQWEDWEAILDAAIDARLQLGDRVGITKEEEAVSEQWRARVRQVGRCLFFSQTQTHHRNSCQFCLRMIFPT